MPNFADLFAFTPTSSAATGPKTEEGKRRSRQNARKHGLTGAGVALPHEDAAEVDRLFADWSAQFGPRNDIEAALVQRAALSTFRLTRIALQETVALSERVVGARNLHRREQLAHVLELGRHLFDDPVSRCDPTGFQADIAKVAAWELHEPALIVLELSETYQGCQWMLDRWRELARTLDFEGFLHYDNKYKLIRLLGKRSETLLEDEEVGRIMVACFHLHPKPLSFHEEMMQASYGCENRPIYSYRTDLLLEKTPDMGLEGLKALVAGEIAHLEARLPELEPAARRALEAAELRASFDDSHEAVLRRRYEGQIERELHRSLATLKKLQLTEAIPPPAPSEMPAPKSPEPAPRHPDAPKPNEPLLPRVATRSPQVWTRPESSVKVETRPIDPERTSES